MRRRIHTINATFADPAADARWPMLKVPSGFGKMTVVGARAVSDTALNASGSNGRQVLLQNGGTDASETTEVAAIPAASGGVDTVGVSAVWTLTVDATAGNFIISDGDESHTAAFDISAANLQTELRTWPSMGGTGVTVSGGPGDSGGTTPYIITVDCQNASFDPDLEFTVEDDSGGTPLSGGGATVDIENTTPGVAANAGDDWVAATPKEMTLVSGATVLDEGEWLVAKYDETGTDTFKNLTVIVELLPGQQ